MFKIGDKVVCKTEKYAPHFLLGEKLVIVGLYASIGFLAKGERDINSHGLLAIRSEHIRYPRIPDTKLGRKLNPKAEIKDGYIYPMEQSSTTIKDRGEKNE